MAYDENDLDASWDQSTASMITLAGDAVRFDGSGATASGSTVTITEAGTYVVTGQAQEAQIVVDCKEVGLVRLVLNGADLTCASSAPIYVKNAEKVVLILADGTQNSLTDGETLHPRTRDSNEPNAAIFVDTDLTINGGGCLTVTANYNDGITSNDDLKIVSGTITVDAVNDAIKGKDCLGVKDAALTVNAEGDGLQSTNDTARRQGLHLHLGRHPRHHGRLRRHPGRIDAPRERGRPHDHHRWRQRERRRRTRASSAAWTRHSPAAGATGPPGAPRPRRAPPPTRIELDRPAATEDEASSSKGLKADGGVFVEGGTFALDCADDTIHSNGTIQIGGGTFTMASGDDAIHADVSVTLDRRRPRGVRPATRASRATPSRSTTARSSSSPTTTPSTA